MPKTNLITTLVCRDYLIEKATNDPSFILTPVLLGGNNPQCRDPLVLAKVQSLVAEFLLTLTLTIGIISAIVAPKLGSLSDQYGRTRILFVSSLGAFFGEVITIAIATFPDSIHYRWLLVGGVFDGLCGSFTTGMAISYAYASDCTEPPKRAQAFGFFHACLFAGIAVGPLLAAILYKCTQSLLAIFYVALGIHLFFMLLLALAIPESLTKKRQLLARERVAETKQARSATNPTNPNPNTDNSYQTTLKTLTQSTIHHIVTFFSPLKILYPTGHGTSPKLRANLIFLAGIDTIMFGVAMGALQVVILYVNFQFEWQTDDTSIFMSVVNTFRVSALIILLPLLNYVFRTRRANRQRRESGFAIPEPLSGSDALDLWSIRFAILMEFLGYLGYGLARSGTGFFIAGIITAFGGIGSPTLQSSLTKHVPHDMVGSLLGATGFLHALSRVVCPLVFNLIYARTVGRYTQAVFVVLAGCFGVAFLFSWLISPHGMLSRIYPPTFSPSRSKREQ